ncbi:MAG: hypothetical protein JWQ16_2825 [Novosphingobium sp.]|nr:hypothetical protein [Novosphingobium sp.]
MDQRSTANLAGGFKVLQIEQTGELAKGYLGTAMAAGAQEVARSSSFYDIQRSVGEM